MLQYELFDFACPERTGGLWFWKASQLAGLGIGFTRAYELEDAPKIQTRFSRVNKDNKLRVSLVRHPCDWLASFYASFPKRPKKGVCLIGPCPIAGFDVHVEKILDYLENPRSCIGFSIKGMFNAYKADVVVRLEDMPWAYIELLESLGVGEEYRDNVRQLKPQNVSTNLPKWNPELRKRVMKAEKEMCDEYEYF